MALKVVRTKGGAVHPNVLRVIKRLGCDISHARRVRMIPTEDFAKRVGISRATLARLEKGDPGVSLHTLAMALHALGRLDGLAELAAAATDDVGLMLARREAPKRISRPRQRKAVTGNEDKSPPGRGHDPTEAEGW